MHASSWLTCFLHSLQASVSALLVDAIIFIDDSTMAMPSGAASGAAGANATAPAAAAAGAAGTKLASVSLTQAWQPSNFNALVRPCSPSLWQDAAAPVASQRSPCVRLRRSHVHFEGVGVAHGGRLSAPIGARVAAMRCAGHPIHVASGTSVQDFLLPKAGPAV